MFRLNKLLAGVFFPKAMYTGLRRDANEPQHLILRLLPELLGDTSTALFRRFVASFR